MVFGALRPCATCSVKEEPPAVPYETPRWLLPGTTSANGGHEDGELVVERFPVTYEGYTYNHGHIAYVKGRPPAPVVLVHPNYAGLKQFDIDQAAFLARVGYVGLAVDVYKEVPEYTFEDRDPRRNIMPGFHPQELTKEQQKAAIRHFKGAFTAYNQCLRNPKHWRGLMGAFLDAANSHPAVKAGLAAAIGYCFGGQAVLEQVRAGHQLQAVVSFHGLLQSYPLRPEDPFNPGAHLTQEEFEQQIDLAPNVYNSKCKVLIENGDLDNEVPQTAVDLWKKEMNGAGIDWRFNNHSGTPHGFALGPGVWATAYHELADRRSTLSMLSLFAEIWPQFPQNPVATNASGTVLGQRILGIPLAKL